MFLLFLKGGGDPLQLNNYRPISKLCVLSKLLEKLLNEQLKTFLEINNILSPFLFFVINSFFFFSHITQHNIQNITKQNNRHILNIFRSNQKGGREGRIIKTQNSLLYTITYIQQKTLPSINGRGPGPTNSRCCTFTCHYLQEATDPICFSTRVV